jgi:hypothetical protein
MSPNQEQSTPKRIWYASYGPNLQRKRLMCYIGGTPEGSAKGNAGCRDKSEPTASRPTSLKFLNSISPPIQKVGKQRPSLFLALEDK